MTLQMRPYDHDESVRQAGLKLALESFEGQKAITTDSIVKRADKFAKFIKEGSEDVV